MKNATDVSIVDDLIEIDSQKGNQNLTDDQDLLIQANVILKFIVGISKKENPEDDLLNTSPDSLSLLSDGFEESFIRDLGDNLIIFLLDNKVNLRTESKEKKEWEYMFMAALVCFRACRYPTGLMQLSRLAHVRGVSGEESVIQILMGPLLATEAAEMKIRLAKEAKEAAIERAMKIPIC
jgi:hypothetical protein